MMRRPRRRVVSGTRKSGNGLMAAVAVQWRCSGGGGDLVKGREKMGRNKVDIIIKLVDSKLKLLVDNCGRENEAEN